MARPPAPAPARCCDPGATPRPSPSTESTVNREEGFMPTENQSAAPLIIEAAITAATRKETNPNVPKSVEEVADDALAAIDAGAAIVHAHCDPFGGPDDEVAERYLASVRLVWQ